MTATHRYALAPWLFLAPALALIAIFSFYPIAHAVFMSFHRWRILAPPDFIALANYEALMHSRPFWLALRNTLVFAFVSVPAGLILALGTALLLNRPLRARGFFRTVIYFPVTVSMVVIALIWSWMFSENYGVVNGVLQTLGLGPRSWLAEPVSAFAVIIVMSVWKGFGYGTVIYLAGLQTIPDSLYEAARIDGASRWRMFRHITLPLLNPTTLFVLVTAFIGSFQVFDQVYVMTEGGPGHSTSVLVHLVYELAYVKFRMGLACAAACILFVITLLFTFLQIGLIRPQTGERR
ncbi:MAG: sugar ABC transporter permease [Candidatus Sumerlaeia bacterium]|nr:sugar ABC transporter permease [Candidatus Sumerlaeia bacterium]